MVTFPVGRYSPCPNLWLSLWSNKDRWIQPSFVSFAQTISLLFSIEFLIYIKPWPTNIDGFIQGCMDYIEVHVLLQKHPPYFWAQVISVLLLLPDLQACSYWQAQSNLLFVPLLVKMHKNCLPPKIKVQDQVSRNAYCLVMPFPISSCHSLNPLSSKYFSAQVLRTSSCDPGTFSQIHCKCNPQPTQVSSPYIISLIGEIRICFHVILFGFA